MYDDGKKSILGSIGAGLLWVAGLALLIYLVYRVGFAKEFSNDLLLSEETTINENSDEVIINEESLEEEILKEEAESNEEAQPQEVTEVPEEPEEVIEEQEETPAETEPEILNYINTLSPEQKVAQLFFLTPEELTGVDKATVFGDMSISAFTEHPVGGLIYFSANLVDPDQTKEMLSKANEASLNTVALPLFIGIDEEGGDVLRLASNPAFSLTKTDSLTKLAESGTEAVASAADYIGQYLKEYGFNVDFAPVADVIPEEGSEILKERSFGSDSDRVNEFCNIYLNGLKEHGILSCYKHFPGIGSASADTHEGPATVEKTLEELEGADLKTFYGGIDASADMIMAGHISLPSISETEELPASLSKYMLTDVLRDKMGYDGLVITDALNMKAITEKYSSKEAALLAFEAGADILLMPENFEEAYNAILEKVNSGEIPTDRLDRSIIRIVRAKLKLI